MPKVQSVHEIRAAIFDMDGTLTDSAGMWLESREAFFRDFKIEPKTEQIKAMIPLGIDGASRYVIDEFHLTNPIEEISQYWMTYAGNRYATDIRFKPGVREYFDLLRQNRIPICLATGCRLTLAHIALDRYGVGHMFDYEICVDETGGNKSSPEVFFRCAAHLGLPAGECAVFEDSVVGICTAYNAGFYTVAVKDAHSAYAIDTIKEHCDLLIEDYRELINK